MIAGAFSSTSGKADSVLTTKGDLATYSTTRIREAVGTNFQTLMANSSEATGIQWAASATSTLTAAGDLLVASGANTLSRLARGSDNYILKMSGTSLNWEAETGGLWTQIGNYRATSEEASTSFSSLGVDLDSEYSKIVLIMSGESAGTGNGGFYLNNISSGSKYVYTQILNDSSTVSGSLITENVINVLPTGLIDTDPSYFNLQLEITFSGIADNFMFQFSGGASHEGNVIGSGRAQLASAGDEIDEIDVSFGGNWAVGTQINVYKVAI